MSHAIRNIAIIAHVDHGKTTLVDKLLKQTGTLLGKNEQQERIMDSNPQEQERGITILAKNTSICWNDIRINILDTPGHADFGGEVERILNMVDSVLLLVDAVDGPMPQTRFVTQKAFAMGFKPIVVINKIDRPGARPDWVLDQTFELFDSLGATDEQLDFPVIYASALEGYASDHADCREGNMHPLLDMIVKIVPPPNVDEQGPLQLQISQLDYDTYTGLIGIGRIQRGSIATNQAVRIIGSDDKTRSGKILQVLGFDGLSRSPIDQASAGNIVALTGLDPLSISDTICSIDCVEKRPTLTVDEPTMSMTFQPNTSPFSGQDGKWVTSRNIRNRLEDELKTNVALRVAFEENSDKFVVSGRGELHLSILIENMRREGFELAVSRAEVIVKTDADGKKQEPYESLVIDIETQHQGTIMEQLGARKATLEKMEPTQDRVILQYTAPTRGLIGFRNTFLSLTSGTGIMHSVFSHYGPHIDIKIGQRNNGVLIANGKGKALAYALYNLQPRGKLFIGHGEEVYTGMVIGIHSKDNDLVVNPLKGKQLTNVRAAGTDENLILVPPIRYTLEQALDFINDDELVEITPNHIRIRKKLLDESDRKRASRES
ncbi:MAG: translational GTPase TypA [Pseudomonadota bacterium]|nr:translational GTPase TypA [Pseudomonadota bacterium]MEC8977400.1 translational GTPase TypA [Pseudomonadota bacterium]